MSRNFLPCVQTRWSLPHGLFQIPVMGFSRQPPGRGVACIAYRCASHVQCPHWQASLPSVTKPKPWNLLPRPRTPSNLCTHSIGLAARGSEVTTFCYPNNIILALIYSKRTSRIHVETLLVNKMSFLETLTGFKITGGTGLLLLPVFTVAIVSEISSTPAQFVHSD